MSLRAIPLIAIAFILYNVIVLLGGSAPPDQVFTRVIFEIPMLHSDPNVRWVFTWGDFLILLHSGYSARKAFAVNLTSSLAMVIGGVLGYYALSALEHWIPTLLALAAASMLYVSVADLIPGLHKRPELHHSIAQVALIAIGIGTIWFAHFLFEHTH